MDTSGKREKRGIRRAMLFFIIGLFLSGLTAFPIESEIEFILKHISFPPFLDQWIKTIYQAVITTNLSYPYLAYGTDWLAFAHILFAILFIGPFIDPVKNKWIIQFGIIACLLIFPLAFIAGHFRSIPIFWRLIDCSFGIIGIIPLWICYRGIINLEKIKNTNQNLKYIRTTNQVLK